jgi:TIR domain
MTPKPEVFLSYSRADQKAVEEVYNLLRSKGLRPWMDVKDILPGEDWQLSINRAIRRSNYFLAFVSQTSVTKGGVLAAELQSGADIRRENLEGERYLIPVRLDRTEVPESLRPYQWIDYFEPSGKKRLLAALGLKGWGWKPWAAAAVLVAVIALLAIWLSRPSPVKAFLAARQNAAGSPSDVPAMIGLTFWELRPSTASDPLVARSLVQPLEASPGGAVELTAVRLPATLAFHDKAKVRLGVESSRSGYLYLFDQDEREGGDLADPFLIFPTNRTRGGNNAIQAGSLVELPPADARPPYWEFRSAGSRGEVLTILVTPKPLPGIDTPPDRSPVDRSQFNRWVRDWKVQGRRAAPGNAAEFPTEEELRARNSASRRLGPDDPAPSEIFAADVEPQKPFLMQFPIRVAGR